MKKQLIIVGIIVLLLAVGLSGCNENKSESELDKFLGTWVAFENYTITFYSNGTFARGEYVNGTYSIVDGRLVLNTTDNTPGVNPDNRKFITIFNYVFSNNDKTLALTIPNTGLGYICTKQ
jgi:hypothetical protein